MYISFHLVKPIVDGKNNYGEISVGYPYEFVKEEEYIKNQRLFLSAIISLLIVVLVTIPISIIGYAMKWIGYNQDQPYLLLICAPLIVFGLGSLFTLTLSIVADVCDEDELETGERREGMFSAVYWWMVKLGLAIASLIGGYLLTATGFHQELGLGQAPDTLFWMRVFDVCIPIVTSIIAIFIIATIDISEEKAHDVRRQLEERRGKA